MQLPEPFASSRMHAETDEDVLIYVGVRREDGERHITSVISHSCGGRGPDGTLRDPCRGIVIFSAPAIQIIWTEPLPVSIPLLLSAPIGAIFFSLPETAHILLTSGTVSVCRRAWLMYLPHLWMFCPRHALDCSSPRAQEESLHTFFFFFFLIGPQE